MRWMAVGSVALLVCVGLGVVAPVPLGSAGAATRPAKARPAIAPGLSVQEHSELVRAGAFGKHPIHVLLLGDSIALTLGVGLTPNAKKDYGVTISNHSTLGCDLDPSLAIFTSGAIGPATQGCREWRGLWPFLTAYEHPNVVALGVGRWEVSDHYFEGHWVHVGEKVWDDHVASDLRGTIKIFQTFGAKVVLFTMPYIDPPTKQPDGQPFTENMPSRARAFNQVVDRVAAADPGEVTAVGLNRMLSPNGVYTDTIDGVTMRWPDGVHITPAGGTYLQPQILPIIDRIALAAEKTKHTK